MRLLFVGDSSEVNTGFGTYHKELLSRITGHEVAELAAWKDSEAPWKCYSTFPLPENHKPHDAFGRHVFDNVIADFKPDWVISHYDPWMFAFIEARKNNFKSLLIPAIDITPIPDNVLSPLRAADTVCAVSAYAKDYLTSQDIKVETLLPNGVDLSVFKVNPTKTSSSFTLGTVMRNQKRKRFPLLFNIFNEFWNYYPNSRLICHTTWPDPYGWKLPELVNAFPCSKNVFFTRICKNCKQTSYSNLDIDDKGLSTCVICREDAAIFPSMKDGYSREQLAHLYNSFDIYLQASTHEGFCMPIAEAKACGVPVLCSNHTALSEHIKGGGALELSFENLMHLAEDTQARENLGNQAAFCAHTSHSWDKTVNKLLATIQSF